MFSTAAKAGLVVGDSLVTINDWNIEAMDNIQVQCVNSHYCLYLYFDHIYHTIDWLQAVISVFLAAGFSVILGWSKTNIEEGQESWSPLDPI